MQIGVELTAEAERVAAEEDDAAEPSARRGAWARLRRQRAALERHSSNHPPKN